MKTLKLIALGIILLVSNSIQAQISVNVNIGSPPAWGPPVGILKWNIIIYPMLKRIMILELHNLFILVEEDGFEQHIYQDIIEIMICTVVIK